MPRIEVKFFVRSKIQRNDWGREAGERDSRKMLRRRGEEEST